MEKVLGLAEGKESRGISEAAADSSKLAIFTSLDPHEVEVGRWFVFGTERVRKPVVWSAGWRPGWLVDCLWKRRLCSLCAARYATLHQTKKKRVAGLVAFKLYPVRKRGCCRTHSNEATNSLRYAVKRELLLVVALYGITCWLLVATCWLRAETRAL